LHDLKVEGWIELDGVARTGQGQIFSQVVQGVHCALSHHHCLDEVHDVDDEADEKPQGRDIV
jgi:hypothetical protein